MSNVLIVADDLSGAADSGVAAAAAGLRTLVLLDGILDTSGILEPPGMPDPSGMMAASGMPDGPQAIAVDADTRRMAPSDAAAQTAKVMRRYYKPGQLVFKKLDSTLRGNIGAELAAILLAVKDARNARNPQALAIVAPAFPAAGRTTRDGIQLLNGVPLEQTEIWRREGIRGRASIPEMLQASGLRPERLDLDLIRHGEQAISAAARELAPGCDALVCDAQTEDDLRFIVSACRALNRTSVWAGSAGLARCLFPAASPPSMKLPGVHKPIVFVVGSASSLSRQQALAVAAEPDVATVVLSPADLAPVPNPVAWQQYNASLSAALSAGRDTVLLLASEKQARMELGPQLCQALAQLVTPHANAIGALVLAGGETARAVLQAQGIGSLWLLGEIEPGVPLSTTTDGALPIVTKAGAFGDQGTLRRCRAALRSRTPNVSIPNPAGRENMEGTSK